MMQANWSVILNVLLLVGVVFAIGRLMRTRKQNLRFDRYQPSLGPLTEPNVNESRSDDIIAVRKVSLPNESYRVMEPELPLERRSGRSSTPLQRMQEESLDWKKEKQNLVPTTVMMFLVAKEKRQFAGYELLQTVLAAGLRFGEGNLFHRHQFANGQGTVLCSLAAATESGVFDLQNMGAFSVRALCLFMQASKNSSIDEERFSIMLETAKQLAEGLDAYLLDDQRKPLTEEGVARYHGLLCINE